MDNGRSGKEIEIKMNTDIKHPDDHQCKVHGYAWVDTCDECKEVRKI